MLQIKISPQKNKKKKKKQEGKITPVSIITNELIISNCTSMQFNICRGEVSTWKIPVQIITHLSQLIACSWMF